jgi:hypothetical protein
MIFLLSPAKTLDYDTPAPTNEFTIPQFMDRSAELIEVLRTYTPDQIAHLMSISDPLAALNIARYAIWSRNCTPENAKQAIFAFDGDVYDGLQAKTLPADGIAYAQEHIRILSGLYGVLRPLDLLQAYRLEFGVKLATSRGRNLYEFWGDTVTENLNTELEQQRGSVVVNLASEEYSKAALRQSLRATVVSPVFEDWSGGRFKIVAFHAKRARGMMARHAINKKARALEDLLDFATDGYLFEPAASTSTRPVFRRRQEC